MELPQKRWGLKREVLFEAVKRLAEVTPALLLLDDMMTREKSVGTTKEYCRTVINRWGNSSIGFAEQLAGTVSAQETGRAFSEVEMAVSNLAECILDKQDVPETGDTMVPFLNAKKEIPAR